MYKHGTTWHDTARYDINHRPILTVKKDQNNPTILKFEKKITNEIFFFPEYMVIHLTNEIYVTLIKIPALESYRSATTSNVQASPTLRAIKSPRKSSPCLHPIDEQH